MEYNHEMDQQLTVERKFTADEVVQILCSFARRDLGLVKDGRWSVTATFNGDATKFLGADVVLTKVSE